MDQPRGQGSNSGSAVTSPPVTMISTLPTASVSELRTSLEVPVLSNPNPLGSASELVDVCIFEGLDGKQRKVRVLFNSGATDNILDFSLASYYHSVEQVKYTSKGVNTTKNYSTHMGSIDILRQDGSYLRIKALKGELSSPAFTLKKKTIDVPQQFASMFARPDLLPVNDVGDLQVTAPIDDLQVQLLIGQDKIAFGPKEEFRLADEGGQMICYRSYISMNLLLSGSRRTREGSRVLNQVGQRRYLVTEEEAEVNLLI